MILVVCEKPSVARDIAAVLGARTRAEGYFEGKEHLVSWALGHLLTPMMPEEIDPAWKAWRSETLPMLPAQIPLKPSPSGKRQLALLKKLMKDKRIESLICATDAGREGELIFRRVYEAAGCKKPFSRLWISSMTEEAIREGFSRLAPSSRYDALYQSAKCRAEADWLVGMNGSRAFTLRYKALLSVGRVQTPTLSLLAARRKEIESFVPEDYFELWADFGFYRAVYLRDNQPRLKTRAEAEAIAAQIKGQTGEVTLVKTEIKRQPPPYLYDLTTLQREANARYGLSAAQTLDIAQALYERHKLLSYPRTDSRFLPNDMKPKISQVLSGLQEPYAALLPATPREPGKRIFDDGKLSDHHAIVPTSKAAKNLNPREAQIYDLVLRRLIAGFCGDYVFESLEARTGVLGHEFKTTGKAEIDKGWQAAQPPIAQKGDEKEEALPSIHEGEKYPVKGSKVLAKKTKAPAQYTENTLLDAMEHAGRFVTDESLREQLKERGLGTPATRAAIIERLIEVGFVRRERRSLLATEKGMKLIQAVPPELRSPETTGKWEKGLRDIERGRLDPLRFMESIRRYSGYLVEAAEKAPSIAFPAEEGKKKRASSKGGKRPSGSSRPSAAARQRRPTEDASKP
ncbi:MAG: DNA topoisomerase 3 [Christensenellaceae bacterium]|jgi:DNA topoisomerase-3|nr:DNA topoisomerase 3 [Christensenellaceae bacterium]